MNSKSVLVNWSTLVKPCKLDREVDVAIAVDFDPGFANAELVEANLRGTGLAEAVVADELAVGSDLLQDLIAFRGTGRIADEILDRADVSDEVAGEGEDIGPAATGHLVAVQTSDDQITAVTPEDVIVAAASEERIVTLSTNQPIIRDTAEGYVAAVGAPEHVICTAPQNDLVGNAAFPTI